MKYLTTLSVAGLYNIECLDDGWMMIWKEGRCRGLIEVLTRHLRRRIQKNHNGQSPG